MRVLLHGGYGRTGDVKSSTDHALAVKLVHAAQQSDGKVLACFFSKTRDEEYLDEYVKTIHAIDDSIKVVIAEQAMFITQLQQHKVVFFQGGVTINLQNALQDITCEQLVADKYCLAGASAGANMLAAWGFSGVTKGEPMLGKGVAPIAFMPHVNAWPIGDYLPKLKAAISLPILLLGENEMVELEV